MMSCLPGQMMLFPEEERWSLTEKGQEFLARRGVIRELAVGSRCRLQARYEEQLRRDRSRFPRGEEVLVGNDCRLGGGNRWRGAW